MSISNKSIVAKTDKSSAYQYPESHWQEIARFLIGSEYDPKGLFILADDTWEAWPYAAHGRPSEACRYRPHFGHLRSFLKPYVKWYCYQRLISGNDSVSQTILHLPYTLTRTDAYLVEHGYVSLDDIAAPAVFNRMWDALRLSYEQEHPHNAQKAAYSRLSSTCPFWKHLRIRFGSPQNMPHLEQPVRQMPTDAGADETRIIPLPVIRQVVNRLALHREGKMLLNRYHHLRLCVLVLLLCTGRRINELLTAPRGEGADGPLIYHPARGAAPSGELWFQFAPNKHGPRDEVYISPEWHDVTCYCVHALLHYSDEVRDMAPPTEQRFLVLVSEWNGTCGKGAAKLPASVESERSFVREAVHGQVEPQQSGQEQATGLSYSAFERWLNGQDKSKWHRVGVLKRWKVTVDGKDDGDIYRLRTHQARHSRQSALALDEAVLPATRQYDLNHINPDMQFAYQHVLREQNEALQQKAREGRLLGPAMPWLATLLGTTYQQAERQSQFQPGLPAEIPTRWRYLIAANPHFLQFNRVACGYCTLPQGPQGCEEYMNCLEAEDSGCRWFVTDPENEQMLIQITQRAHAHRKQAAQSAAAGRTVQAGKYEILAQRAEDLEGEALRHASQDLRTRLAVRRREIEEGS